MHFAIVFSPIFVDFKEIINTYSYYKSKISSEFIDKVIFLCYNFKDYSTNYLVFYKFCAS